MISRTIRLAHRLLRIAALADRIVLLTKKYPKVTGESIRKYAEMDPTNGKYLEWLVKQESDGTIKPNQLTAYEDEVRDVINFHRKVSQNSDLQDITGLPKDLGKVPIYEVSKQMKARKYDLEEADIRKKDAKEKGFKVVYNKVPYKIIQFGGEEIPSKEAVNALCYYGINKWCTRYENKAREYLEAGPMWIVFKNGKTILQTNGVDFQDVKNQEFSWDEDSDLPRILVNLGILSERNLALLHD